MILCHLRIVFLLLTYLICPSTCSLCGGGSAEKCPVKVADYSQRSTSTFICNVGVIPSPANNYCMRDDIAAYKENNDRLIILANGCPGHPFFVHGELTRRYSVSGSTYFDSASCGGSCGTNVSCCSGGCGTSSCGTCSTCGSSGCGSSSCGTNATCGSGTCGSTSSCSSGSCGTNATCGSGSCGTTSSCGSGGSCGTNATCGSGSCGTTSSCGSGGSCGTNATCGSGSCGTTSSCGSGGSCGTNATCGSGSCGTTSSCGSGGSCGTNATCGSGSCGTTSSCGSGGSCSSGSCGAISSCSSCGSARGPHAFHSGSLQERRLCCASNCALSDSSTSSSSNPFIPRYQDYRLRIPLYPKVSSDEPMTLLDAFPYDAAKYPVGVAINGILITNKHYNDTGDGLTTMAMVKDFDNCGGHGDRSNRYHYHDPPVCLLLALGATIPATGTQFLYEQTSEAQIAHWPENGKPSPLLGYALDGFPIYGPYNSSGVLQIAGSGHLNECLYSEENGRYHMTANYPFTPPCLVGDIGAFSSRVVNKGVCAVIDSAYCSDDECQPVSLECEYDPNPFSPGIAQLISIYSLAIAIVWFAYIKVSNFLYPNDLCYPFDKTILSMIPAMLLLAGQQVFFKIFFGIDKLDFENFDLDGDAMDVNLNEGVAAYLAITGILYSLIVAHIFLMTDDKLKKMRDALGEELSGCRQVVLCLQAIHADEEEDFKLKEDAIRVVIWYLGTLIKHWGVKGISVHEEMQSLDLLYGSLSLVDRLCGGGSKSSFNVQVADRVMDSMNSISDAKYRRYALEELEIPSLLWILLYLIASSMFAGVMLIRTGSDVLNLAICYVTTILIGMNTFVIADMDMPYRGFIKLRIDTVIELFDYMSGIVQSKSQCKTNLVRRTVAFFSSTDARRNSLANVQEMISAKVRKRNNRISVINSLHPQNLDVLPPSIEEENYTSDEEVKEDNDEVTMLSP